MAITAIWTAVLAASPDSHCYAATESTDASLHTASKTLHLGQTLTDTVFVDASGREVLLHGWNVSGSVKLASQGFKPFRNRADAEQSFALMRQFTGANLVRFTLAWEGTHPSVDTVDTDYLDAIAEQVQAAIDEQMYVVLDYHTDLYSRYLFEIDDPFTGNGAPQWIIDGGNYNVGRCTALCFNWSMHNIINPRVRRAYRNFWNNAPIYTVAGERHVQDEFLWQLKHSLRYLKTKFSARQWQFIIGLQPFNEPNYGNGHISKADEFDNEKLWPFYRRVRATMDSSGWQQQAVFAEPLVFWDTNAGFFTPPTGGHYLRDIPPQGYVFAPHFYDAARMGVTNLNRVENAEYFPNLERIRSESRFLNMPVVLGEFGMWLGNQNGGAKDFARVVNATYQAMDASDSTRPAPDRHLDFHTLPVSGTQWHWDIYKDQHAEPRNGNPDTLVRAGDGWNGEDFSVIKQNQLSVGTDSVSRIYPRAIQGRLVHFFYHPLARDGANKTMDWAAVEVGQQRLFAHNPFALLTWQGTHSKQAGEIFIPPQFTPERITLITETGIWRPGDSDDHIRLQPDRSTGESGYLLQIKRDSTTATDLHFALVVIDAGVIPAGLPEQLQQHIALFQHPVVLTGTMTGQNYPPDPAQEEAVKVQVTTTQFLIFRQLKLSWSSDQPVSIFKGNKVVFEGAATGQHSFFSLVGLGDEYRVCSSGQPEQCSRTLTFQ